MSPPQRPHILLITTDQQRYDALGINGNRVLETPNLDMLAAGGVNFSRGYVTCPVCIPARRTLLSGLSPDNHGLRGYRDGLDWDPPTTLPAELGRGGYQTQLVGKLHMHPQGKRYGFDHMVLSETSNWRPDSPEQPRNDYVRWLRANGVAEHPHFHGISGNGRLARPWPLEERFHHNNWLAQRAVQFLTEDRDPTSPFFLHLSFLHPHPPLVPPRDYFERYLAKEVGDAILGEWCPEYDQNAGPLSPISSTGPFDPAIIRRARAAYFALINHIDDCIAFVLERWMEYGNLREREPLYVVFTSDHGEMLGDHQLFRKSLGYEASAHVPFFITGYHTASVKARCEELVCWEDIAPTLIDLAGLPVPEGMDGRSLAPIVRGESGALPLRTHLFGQCEGPLHNLWIVEGPWKYLWFPKTNEEQLFNLEEDSSESRDRSGDAGALAPLRRRLRESIAQREDLDYREENLVPCAGAQPQIFWP